MKINHWSSWVTKFLGLSILGYFVYQADWQLVASILAQLEKEKLFPLFFLSAIEVGVRAWRWRILLKLQQITISLHKAWSVYSIGVFLGSFTPGRLGDIGRALYLRQDKLIPWEKAMAGSLIDRLFDVIVVLVLGIWANYHFKLFDTMPIEFIGLIGCLFFFVFLFLNKNVMGFGDLIFNKLRSYRLFSFITATLDEMSGLVSWIGLVGLILTIVAQGVYCAQTMLLLHVLGISLSFGDVVGIVSLISLAAFLPISIAGLGPREAVIAIVFAKRSIPHFLESTLSYSGLFIVFCYLLPVAIGGVYWLKNPLPLQLLQNKREDLGEN
jgi:glycosyltransferase 2 family protein